MELRNERLHSTSLQVQVQVEARHGHTRPAPHVGCPWRRLGRASAALITVALALAPTALAGGTGTFPHLYDIGSTGDFYPPSDVAVFADGDTAKHVFVADRGDKYRIVRYAGTGQTNVLDASVALTAFGKYTPIGLAVNDVRGSTGFGNVYATQYWNNIDSILWVFDTALATVNGHLLTGVRRPIDVALDAEGNVYVSDQGSANVNMYTAALVQVPWVPLLPTKTFNNTVTPLCISVDHNNRVHSASWNSYTVFNADTTPKASISMPFSMAVCALNPCADGYVARLMNGAYDFVRYNWDWCNTTGATDMTSGLGWIFRPEGMEYQKFNYGIFTGQSAPYWQQQRCDERMFVCSITREQHGKICSFGQSTLSVPVPAGRRAWWRFEETQDSNLSISTNCLDALGPNAAVPVGVPRTVEGRVRSGFDTKSGTVYATVANSPQLSFGTGSLSIEGWFRSEQTTGVVSLMDKRIGTGAGWSVYLYNGFLGFQTNVGGGLYQNYTASMSGCGTKAAVGAWKHFVIVLDRTVNVNTVTIYLDGVRLGTPIASLAGNIDNTGPLYLGRDNLTDGGTSLQGALDEVTLYAAPLTALEVLGIFNAGGAGKHLYISSDTGG